MTLIIGIILSNIGWLILTLVTTKTITVPVYITVFGNFLYQHGNAWIIAVVVATVAQNFPLQDRGKALGITKGYVALSSAFIATIKSFLSNDNINVFMVLLLIISPLVGLTQFIFVQRTPDIYAKKYMDTTDMGYTHCFSKKTIGIQNQNMLSLRRNTESTKQEISRITTDGEMFQNGNFKLWHILAIFFAILLASTSLIRIYVTSMEYIWIYSKHIFMHYIL